MSDLTWDSPRGDALARWPVLVEPALAAAKPTELLLLLSLFRQLDEPTDPTEVGWMIDRSPRTIRSYVRQFERGIVDLSAGRARLADKVRAAPWPGCGGRPDHVHRDPLHVLHAYGQWRHAAALVLQSAPRPSSVRVMLSLSRHLGVTGADELEHAEWIVQQETLLHPATINAAVHWLRDLGVLGRTPGDGRRRHRIWLQPDLPAVPGPRPHHWNLWE